MPLVLWKEGEEFPARIVGKNHAHMHSAGGAGWEQAGFLVEMEEEEEEGDFLSNFSRWLVKKFLGVYFAYGSPSGYLRKVQFCYQNSIYFGEGVCISQWKFFFF